MIQTARATRGAAKELAMPASDRPGVIEASAAYTLPEFQARTGMSKWAMRSARRNGLKVRRVGKRAFILGRDAIEFIEQAG